MKKSLSILLSIIIMIAPITCSADSSWLAVPANYALWAKYYFDLDIDEEIKGPTRDNEDHTVMKMDKISTYSNRQTMDVIKVSLIVYDTNITYTEKLNQENMKRFFSFICAIEGGNLINTTSEEIRKGIIKAIEVRTAMDSISDTKYEQAWKGKYVEFYKSEIGTYYLHYEMNSRYLVSFFPIGQYPAK